MDSNAKNLRHLLVITPSQMTCTAITAALGLAPNGRANLHTTGQTGSWQLERAGDLKGGVDQIRTALGADQPFAAAIVDWPAGPRDLKQIRQ